MRLILFPLLTVILSATAVQAQSIMDNLPPQNGVASVPDASLPVKVPVVPVAPPASSANADPYTVTDVNADVTADSAAHARDQALIQAERTAFTQLCARLVVPDSVAKINDDALAGLVQSFDVQSEKSSSVRYIAVFTIHFKAAALQKKLGHYLAGGGEADVNGASGEDVKAALLATAGHLTVSVQTPSLPAFTQTKRRLSALPQVAGVDTLDLGRGVSHVDVRYTGTLENLQAAMMAQGLVLRPAINGEWELVNSGAQ